MEAAGRHISAEASQSQGEFRSQEHNRALHTVGPRELQRLHELGSVTHVAVREDRYRQPALDQGNLVQVGGAVAPSHRRAAVSAVDGEQSAASILARGAEHGIGLR